MGPPSNPGVLFSSPTDVGSHTPPPGLSVLTGTHSFLQSMWDPHQIRVFRSPPQPMWDLTLHPPPPSGLSILASTSLRIYPLRGIASLLTHHLVSSFDTVCNGPSPPLADIFLFGLSLWTFSFGVPLNALKRVC